MLQALYSRSPQSVVSHLEKVKAAGSGKFMEQFYGVRLVRKAEA
jgi:hypothetical protein